MLAIESAAIAALEGTLDPEPRHGAEREARKLAGTAATFGFHEGRRLARALEGLLGGSTTLDQGEAMRLSELVVALRRELEGKPDGQPALPEDQRSQASKDGPLLLLVDDDRELSELLVVEATARGLRVETAVDLAGARAAIARECPTVVLLDLALARKIDGDLRLMTELTSRTPAVPVLVLTDRNTLVERLEVAGLGARAFLHKPLTPVQILEAATRALPEIRSGTDALLVLDDDPQVLALLRALLEPRGFKVTTVDDPRRFWTALEQAEPDLLVLDVDMPGFSGIDLCRAVRNDARWSELPVLFLTVLPDAETISRLFAAGADDYVSKPIVGPELLARITIRLERSRVQQRLAETDPLTGVADRRRSDQVLEQFRRLADRHGQTLSLAVLDVDRFKEVNDRHGHGAGDHVMRWVGQLLLRSFRGEDVVVSWGRGEFTVGMYGARRDESMQRLDEALENLREQEFTAPTGAPFRVTFSAGVAEYPADGLTIQALYRAADAALYQAKARGRDRVLPARLQSEEDQTAETADVVLVDDDPALADLLLHALDTRGYRTQWLQDGEAAARALAGPSPSIRARLVLLEVNLPGLDGFGVLRRLVEDGITQQTRVIMLTARAGEDEILQALELGAVDHVAKPFSVPVLMQRIHRALQA